MYFCTSLSVVPMMLVKPSSLTSVSPPQGESAACHWPGCAPDGLLARTDAPISLCDGCTAINCTISPSRDRSPRSACSPKSSRDAKVDWWDHTVAQHGEALAHGLHFVAWQGAGIGYSWFHQHVQSGIAAIAFFWFFFLFVEQFNITGLTDMVVVTSVP